MGHLRGRDSVFGLAATSDKLTTWLVSGYFYGDAAPTLISYFLDSCWFRFTFSKINQYCWLGVGKKKEQKDEEEDDDDDGEKATNKATFMTGPVISVVGGGPGGFMGPRFQPQV